jgi:hypothetical protein
MRKPWTKEQRLRQSEKLTQHFKTHDAPMKGRKFTQEHKDKLRLAKLGTTQSEATLQKRFEWRKHRRPKPFSAQARANCSTGAIKRILKYGLPYNKNRVEYFDSMKMGKRILCRSGWEKLVYQQLEKDPCVTSYWVESFTIPYVFEGSTHQYLPDVLVEWCNGYQELLEIKPAFKLKEKKTMAKIEAATTYAMRRGWGFNIVDEKDIAELKGGE